MKRRSSGNVNLVEFENITSVVEFIKNNGRTKTFLNCASSERAGSWWNGTKSLDEALNLFQYGWDEKTKELKEVLGKPNLKQKTYVKSFFTDVLGFQAIVPNYLMGLPKTMVNSYMKPIKSKIINICVTCNYLSDVSAKEIFENAINQTLVVNTLESMGYRVNLSVLNISTAGGRINALKIKVKSSTEKLNLSKLSFALIHPSMLRRIVFALFERLDEYDISDFKWGYGRSIDDKEMQKNENIKNLLGGEYILPSFLSREEVKSENFFKNFENFAK